jgi:leader peptidase (prepilin peptidase)/N-methyltransferase
VDTLLVSATTVAGLVIGFALDPVGQRLADRSRAEDQARRAEQAEADGVGSDRSGIAPDPGLGPRQLNGSGTRPQVAGNHQATGRPINRTVSGLLPSGRSPVRRLVAAVVTGVLFGAAASHFGSHLIVAPFCVFFAMLVVVSVTDLSHGLVPRYLIYAAMSIVVPLLVATSAVDHRWYSLGGSAIAGAVAFGVFFAVWWFVPQGMGLGDVRLAGAIGVTLGYLSLLHAYEAFLVGFVVGAVFGLVVAAVTGSGRKARIPFGPSLAVGAVFAVLWGGQAAHTLFHAGS